jgi:HJR/Mrr/RecB family endonuclease
MSAASSKRPLTQLNHEIEQAEAETSRLQNERAAVATDVSRAARRLRYLRLARSLRGPTARFEMWPLAVLILGGGAVGFLSLVLVGLITSSFSLALLAFVIGLLAGTAAFGSLLYQPTDEHLPTAINEAEAQSRLAAARLQEKTERLAETQSLLQRLIDERRDQIASGKLQRAALLQRPWKSMRGAEWEDFVVEVLRTHGATVDRTGRAGTEEANLIAEFGKRRVAIFTEGEGQNVSSATIQQAIAAKDRHHCDASAVIINRRFTGAAQDFAKRNGCAAIGSSEFPDFVLGKIEL